MCQFYCCVMLMRIVQAEVVIGQCGCNETMVEQVGKQICSQHKKAAMSIVIAAFTAKSYLSSQPH